MIIMECRFNFILFCFSLGIILTSCEPLNNACCSYPCKHRGVCMSQPNGKFKCDCQGTGYYGKTCRLASWSTWFSDISRPSPEVSHYIVGNLKWLWKIVNQIHFIRAWFMKMILQVRTGFVDIPPVYLMGYDYPIIENMYNRTRFARTLPQVPLNCPTPMGTKGPQQLPSIDLLADTLFRRIEFKPCKIKTNTLFAAYAQHFTHMFFKTDYNHGHEYTWASQTVDMTNIYGKDRSVENGLRSFIDGKLKSQKINGEDYPEFVDLKKETLINPRNVSQHFKFGHPMYHSLPTFIVFSVILHREHNRVAEILKSVHPDWDDERLFQTTKLITLMSIIKITIEDYVQHLSNYQFRLLFDPTSMHQSQLQYDNRIFFEYNLLYHWHPLIPDSVQVDSVKYNVSDWYFNSTNLFIQHGMKKVVEAMVNTPAGQIGPNNHGAISLPITLVILNVSRTMRLQPFNEYRKRFGMRPYKSFIELTGDEKMANDLERFYEDVDAVEFYVGLLVERREINSFFGQTTIEMGSPFSLQGLLGNSFASPYLWRESTFGGETGFNIVKSANLKDLFCNNLPPPCPRISFKTAGENWDTVDEYQTMD